jgi:hypothetical protein
MTTIPTPAVIAILLVAAVVILMIPDRHKPWWERRKDRDDAR